jgi:type IV pilus assembly protein PilN
MKRWLGWPAVVAAIAAVVTLAALHVMEAVRHAKHRDFLGGEIAKLDAEIGEVRALWPMIGDYLARQHVLETLERDRGQGLRLLNEVTRQRPEGVRFVSVAFSGGRLRVEGVAASEQALRRFTSAVAASSVLQAPEGLATRGVDFSFQTALRAAKEQ